MVDIHDIYSSWGLWSNKQNCEAALAIPTQDDAQVEEQWTDHET